MSFHKTLLFLLLCIQLNAQLMVGENTFIYVNDNYIFINEPINLSENSSTMYLRNQSQLLQGDNSDSNIGQGCLSVYQDGTVDAYEYNYWCSPVGIPNNLSTNTNFGIILLNDRVDNLNSLPAGNVINSDYNGTASPLNIEPSWIWKFISSTNYSEWLYVGNAINVSPGEGFTMKGTNGISPNNSGSNQLYDFRGKPNTGLIENNVSAAEWTLIGNPYPSAMDLRDFIWDANNINAITGALYFWQQDTTVNSHLIADYIGGYATYTINSSGTIESFVPATFNTYNSDGSLNAVGSPNLSGPTVGRYAAIGQGFMVEGSSMTNGIVRTTNEHRVYYRESGPESVFFRNDSANTNNQSMNSYSRFRINIDFNSTYTRQLLHTFCDEATSGVDYGLDAKSPSGVASDAYWLIDEEEFVAQAQSFDVTMRIPLRIDLDSLTVLNFRIGEFINSDNIEAIFLHDKYLNIYIDLLNGENIIELESGIWDDRFEIVFQEDNVLSVTDKDIFSSIKIFHRFESEQVVVFNPLLHDFTSLEIYDNLGRLVSKINALNFKDKRLKFSTHEMASGIYYLRLLDRYNKAHNSKFLVQ